MPQFFVAPEDIQKKAFRLTGPEAFHVVKVLRYAPGQSLALFDGQGGRFEGVIERLEADGSVSGKLTATLKADDARKPVKVHLYLGLLKASHWDYALEKATELGAASIVPVLTPRTVVLLHEAQRAQSKADRWARVVMAAAKQCGRAELPPVREPVQFRDAVRAAGGKGLILVAWEGMKGSVAAENLRLALREADQGRGAESLDVHLFIGPEGGFSNEEIELAEAGGAVVFGMGPRVLRAETAAAAALTLVQYEFGSL
ncbi:MAG: 16S rRNA (uracil(1498)-N(3))-methyltransferase [Elusimicrobia bacterium]|nr:16S rRNA (uracil(1498)-N(3))-methyltransferase [Elusimicrobiota bacterium]